MLESHQHVNVYIIYKIHTYLQHTSICMQLHGCTLASKRGGELIWDVFRVSFAGTLLVVAVVAVVVCCTETVPSCFSSLLPSFLPSLPPSFLPSVLPSSKNQGEKTTEKKQLSGKKMDFMSFWARLWFKAAKVHCVQGQPAWSASEYLQLPFWSLDYCNLFFSSCTSAFPPSAHRGPTLRSLDPLPMWCVLVLVVDKLSYQQLFLPLPSRAFLVSCHLSQIPAGSGDYLGLHGQSACSSCFFLVPPQAHRGFKCRSICASRCHSMPCVEQLVCLLSYLLFCECLGPCTMLWNKTRCKVRIGICGNSFIKNIHFPITNTIQTNPWTIMSITKMSTIHIYQSGNGSGCSWQDIQPHQLSSRAWSLKARATRDRSLSTSSGKWGWDFSALSFGQGCQGLLNSSHSALGCWGFEVWNPGVVLLLTCKSNGKFALKQSEWK